ncbi:DNA mismatch endonuclease Vsr [Agrobacterium vitis]|uniref:DNA mismatch endonuclease Vsr n=1 Tax=Agrobacterium vitis TaxID=373 RepID=UPI0015DA33CC|nr:DNA mismatch endonuclease Vsr [Agrobacterium vitis]
MTIDDSRSKTMRAVRSKDTKPELIVRRLLHSLGFRFRLHRRDLPGSPDLVFPGRHKVIFVHGCFWHGHDCSRGARVPKTNQVYWTDKVKRNRERDERSHRLLSELGWTTCVVWECEIKDRVRLTDRVLSFLND